ncbi:MAG: hypothetical protein J5493_06670 [Lachnospiraceae bacterium]|nr:hypothetical protein [Lachnospiraceae bacterium]
MKEYSDDILYYTDRGWDALYDVADDPNFHKREAAMIYDCLLTRMRQIPFCDYLKRFLYQNAELDEPFLTVPLTTYQEILKASFRERGTPASFSPSTTKLSAAAANWLNQKTAARNTVLLLGFGLGLSPAEADDFFVKALHEDTLRPGDPRELICAWCFEHQYTWPKYEQLWEKYEKEDWTAEAGTREAALMALLKELKTRDLPVRTEKQYRTFEQLYENAKGLLAFNYNRTIRQFDPIATEDITAADMEHILYAVVPKDVHGNLIPARQSSLYPLFDDKRLTRQRINSLLRREIPVLRSDLITLNFFIWSQVESDEMPPRHRYMAFTEETNQLLSSCGFGELYGALPYDCFIMLCLLAEDPMMTYTDVWEKSYNNQK